MTNSQGFVERHLVPSCQGEGEVPARTEWVPRAVAMGIVTDGSDAVNFCEERLHSYEIADFADLVAVCEYLEHMLAIPVRVGKIVYESQAYAYYAIRFGNLVREHVAPDYLAEMRLARLLYDMAEEFFTP